MIDIDPVSLVRGRGRQGTAGLIAHYINDRPYVASSLLSVAISRVYASALAGRCRDKPELAREALELTAHLPVVPVGGDSGLVERLFAPLGYQATTVTIGQNHAQVTLEGTVKLTDLLAHLYVLVPVLDDNKHYWVGDAEVDKLVKYGEAWLARHPERELISFRYLKHVRSLAEEALDRVTGDESPSLASMLSNRSAREDGLEATLSLAEARRAAILEVVKRAGVSSVIDLGCGEGRLIEALLDVPQVARVLGYDASLQSLKRAHDRLRLDQMPELQRRRIKLVHGGLTYRDKRLAGYDVAVASEVIEHLDPGRLAAFERALFESAGPRVIVVTTPNSEYNPLFDGLAHGELRHSDHRFEWDRSQFHAWARETSERFGYKVSFSSVGPQHPTAGAPTQMGVFEA